ncbi:MAG: hypothetical protein HPY83_06115 [Anaerolineae bacterium]|nr:hypothetical protein [Anaerolineae bacterium]
MTLKGPKAPYVLALVSVVATLWVTFGLTSEFFGLFENVVGLVFGIILGLAIAQVFVVPKQKLQWERIRLRRKYGNTGRYRELAPPDEEERSGGWAAFFSPGTWNKVNVVLGFGLLLMLFAFGVANILTALMAIVSTINVRMLMVNYQAIKRIEADEREPRGR